MARINFRGTVTVKRANEHTWWYRWFGKLFGRDRVDIYEAEEAVSIAEYPTRVLLVRAQGYDVFLGVAKAEAYVDVSQGSTLLYRQRLGAWTSEIKAKGSYRGITWDFIGTVED